MDVLYDHSRRSDGGFHVSQYLGNDESVLPESTPNQFFEAPFWYHNSSTLTRRTVLSTFSHLASRLHDEIQIDNNSFSIRIFRMRIHTQPWTLQNSFDGQVISFC